MISNNLDVNISDVKNTYLGSLDINFRSFEVFDTKCTLIYNQSLCSSDKINDYILKNISIANLNKIKFKENIIDNFINIISGHNIKKSKLFDDLYKYLSNGFAIVLFDNCNNFLAIEVKQNLSRSISEPLTEQTVNGPKDSFNEDYMTNIGLIRKRIKSKKFIIEEMIIGKETKNKVSVMYMDNLIEKPLLNEIKEKLNKIDTDSILDSTYIRQFIVSKETVFPLVETTERPDLTVISLLKGKICILAENSPYVLIIPTFLIDFFHTPEDYYQKPKNVTFTRIIRIFAFIISIILPAFYVAITTYNHETIPVTLIINFAAQRFGVPFPTVVEALGMILVFEILRESDIRMPKLSGSAISILGAIVLGDAAVKAGIVSPIMVIIIAISSICNLMFSHVSVVNAIRIWKILFVIFASILGLPGIFFCLLLFLIIVSSIKSFGKPYLYPLAPLNTELFKDDIVKKNIKNLKKKDPILVNEENE